MTKNQRDGLVRADSETAFVLGNGPSLRNVHLPALSGFATIGMNAAYRYWREINWRPTYYACLDTVVGLSHRESIAELIAEGRIEWFLLRANLLDRLGALASDPRVVNFDAEMGPGSVYSQLSITTGSMSVLWAAELGFKKIIIHGVDARYTEVVRGAERRDGIELEIVDTGENPNYFFAGYQQPGDRYNLPNPRPDLHVNAWREAGARLRTLGVKAYNANSQSGVRCFDFVDLESLLGDGANAIPADESLPKDLPIDPVTAPEPLEYRLKTFIVTESSKLIVSFLLLVIAGLSGAYLGSSAAIALVYAVLLAMAFVIIYSRHMTSRQLDRQTREILRLREAIKTVERRQRNEFNVEAAPRDRRA